jgi:hypothetical protein
MWSSFAGILEREQEQSVVYGSIDFGKTVVTNEKYTDLVSPMLFFTVPHLSTDGG